MKAISKTILGAGAAAVAALGFAAPAEAQYRDRYYDRDRGIDAGDIITGVAVLGGIAAIASAIGRDGSRYGYGYGNRYRGNYNYAVQACAQEAQRMGRGQVQILDVDRAGNDRYRVRGIVQAGYGGVRRLRSLRSRLRTATTAAGGTTSPASPAATAGSPTSACNSGQLRMRKGWARTMSPRPFPFRVRLYTSRPPRLSAFMTVQPSETILIVDFGSQVTQLIARRVREAGVYSEIAPFNAADAAFERLKPKGIILSGGPSSVMWDDSPRAPQHFFDAGVPILAICYGQQTMAHQLGGRVAPSDSREFGRAFIEIVGDSMLFDGLWSRASGTRSG